MTRTWSLSQTFRYDYPGPVADLEQRLVVVPPLRHGDQRRLRSTLDVSQPVTSRRERVDGFGNTVVELAIPHVEGSVTFCSDVVIERRERTGRFLVRPDRRLAQQTRLTRPDAALAAVAAELADAARGDQRAIAEAACQFSNGAITYRWGVTHVATTAAEALAGGVGVCQDNAHIMLAVCRAAGVPGRYVSGHLEGEGGSHAWVEVLLDAGDAWEVVALDPCNARATGLQYVTVAVGRDYADVAPVSGTYDAPYEGVLSVSKRAGELAAAA